VINNEGSLSFNNLRIDYGRLLQVVLYKRNVGAPPYLVGSRPPEYDSLWKYVEKEGYEIKIFDRNCVNHEKQVDGELNSAITETVTRNAPGIVVLISGDKDMVPGLWRALKFNWKVEIWFWSCGILSNLNVIHPRLCNLNLFFTGFCSDLKNLSVTYNHLGHYYKRFTYGYGPDVTRTIEFLDIMNGYMFQNNDIMEWFVEMNLFCWMSRKGRNVRLYFKNRDDLSNAKNWIKKNRKYVKFWNEHR
jgi:hypothetical protein